MKNNKLLNAIGTVDDRHIRADEFSGIAKLADPGSANKSKSKKLRVVLIAAAAAAAAVLALVGFTTAETVKNTVIVEGVGQVKLELYRQDITIIPKDELPWVNHFYSINMPTEELLAKFGVSPLMNDNFSYDVTPSRQWHTCDDEGNSIPVNICLPAVWYDEKYVTIDYCLYNKRLDKNVRISTLYPTVDDLDVGFIIEKDKGYTFGEHELIKLNDGSDCQLSDGGARFAHDGVYYFFYCDENFDKFDIETQKQIISDFGLL